MNVMKTVVCVLGLFALLIPFPKKTIGQNVKSTIAGIIEPSVIDISNDKTTNLVFPFSIIGVDRGSRDVLVQKAQGADNILQLKASIEYFKPTNLSVIAADGNLYSFVLKYAPEPFNLNFRIGEMLTEENVQALYRGDKNEAELHRVSESVKSKRAFLKRPKDKSFGVGFIANGIYIHNDVLYFQFEVENETFIGYDTDQFRLFIRDKKKTKRSATQELELSPLYINGNVSRIDGNTKKSIVIALEKMTIPNKKQLVIQLMENNGGRHLEVRLNNRHMVKAKMI